jgi:transcriptional regulator with XRE-family HTH domain
MKNKVTSIFADRLQDLIAESGKTISELSSPSEIGISSGSLSKYQNDAAEPGITALVKIADYFGVSFDYLLGKSESKKRENFKINKRLGLSDNAISSLEEYVNDTAFNTECEKYGVTPPKIINSTIVSNAFVHFLDCFCTSVCYAAKYQEEGGDKALNIIPPLDDPERFAKLDAFQGSAPKGFRYTPLNLMASYEMLDAQNNLDWLIADLKSIYFDKYLAPDESTADNEIPERNKDE